MVITNYVGTEVTQGTKWPSFHLEFLPSIVLLIPAWKAQTLCAAGLFLSYILPNL